MTKAEIIERLEAEGIDHDPNSKKAVLAALLPTAIPEAVNYTPPTTAEPVLATPTHIGSKRDLAQQVIDAGKSDKTFSTLVGLHTIDDLQEMLDS